MSRTGFALAFYATLISATAMILTIIVGAVMFAIEGLLRTVTLGQATGMLDSPLDRRALVPYACGIALRVTASPGPRAPAHFAALPRTV